MANKVEFVAGAGINITADASNKKITIASTGTGGGSSSLTSDQLAALNNSEANGTNKFVTENEVASQISSAIGLVIMPITPGPLTPPPGYPKLITSSGIYNIPQNGRYRIKFCGGGGGGSGSSETNNSMPDGANGGETSITINGVTYRSSGGNGARYIRQLYGSGSGNIVYWNLGGVSEVPYDGLRGSAKGGNGASGSASGMGNSIVAENGQNAAENGGDAGGGLWPSTNSNLSGGGAGGVIAGEIYAGDGTTGQQNAYSPNQQYLGGKGGKGYGAGGGGGGNSKSYNTASGPYVTPGGAGGASGYLESMTLVIAENTPMNIIIGSGGIGGTGTKMYPENVAGNGGNGAQGAVFIEWIANS